MIFQLMKLPVASWIENLTSWMTKSLSGFFGVIQDSGQKLMGGITGFLTWINPWILILLVVGAAFYVSRYKWGFTSFTFLGLVFILNQGLWQNLMGTFTLVLLSGVVSILLGIPLGIWGAKSKRAQAIIKPILDFMQTMPAFVYLIPAVAFFGIGTVPGVFASVIFALPPTVRMTTLGINSVSKEMVEAADSFGATGRQKLFKVELPAAKNTIMAGINQTLMLGLSMVVTASMIGAPGLGEGVLAALQRAQVGNGFVNGLALVILAIIIDRMTQYANERMSENKIMSEDEKHKRKTLRIIVAGLAVVGLGGSLIAKNMVTEKTTAKTVKLVYTQWDTEVASTNVIAEVLRNEGYQVKMTALDNAVMWQSVANGESDAMVSAWLPVTHREQYQKFHSKLDNLGPNLAGVKTGLAVPKYVKVNSIADLNQEAGQKIIGIEPGAGVVSAAENTLKAYPNLKSWKLSTSSTGAMTIALGKAIKKKEPIVVTAWSPHWMFAKYDLKYLADPKRTMGKGESINTVVRKNLAKDSPEVHQILDKFHWSQKDMQQVMLDVNHGMKPKAAAKKWIAANPEKVKEWTK